MENCFIERWISSLRRELLDRTIIWNEPQFRRLVADYLDRESIRVCNEIYSRL